MASARQNGGANVIALSGIDITPTPITPIPHGRCYSYSFSTNEKRKYSTDGDDGKYMDVLTGGLLYSIHIQFSSQNESLLSSI